MKITKAYFILLFTTALLSCYYGFSQNSSQNEIKKIGLNEKELTIACENFAKMIKTDTYISNKKITKEFAKKIGPILLEIPKDYISNHELFNSWMEKNIAKTKFKNISEAKILFNNMVASTEELMKENVELYDLINKATVEQIIKIRKPLRDNF